MPGSFLSGVDGDVNEGERNYEGHSKCGCDGGADDDLDGSERMTSVVASEDDGEYGCGHGGLDDHHLFEFWGDIEGVDCRKHDEGEEAEAEGAGAEEHPGSVVEGLWIEDICDGGADEEQTEGYRAGAEVSKHGCYGLGKERVEARGVERETEDNSDDWAVDEKFPLGAACAAQDRDSEGPDGEFDTERVEEENPEDFIAGEDHGHDGKGHETVVGDTAGDTEGAAAFAIFEAEEWSEGETNGHGNEDEAKAKADGPEDDGAGAEKRIADHFIEDQGGEKEVDG